MRSATDGLSVRDYPRFMDGDQYRRYLTENKKTELRRYKVKINDFGAATLKLEQALAAKRIWLVLPHNCVPFVEEVVHAGGARARDFLNCPRLENFE